MRKTQKGKYMPKVFESILSEVVQTSKGLSLLKKLQGIHLPQDLLIKS